MSELLTRSLRRSPPHREESLAEGTLGECMKGTRLVSLVLQRSLKFLVPHPLDPQAVAPTGSLIGSISSPWIWTRRVSIIYVIILSLCSVCSGSICNTMVSGGQHSICLNTWKPFKSLKNHNVW